MDNRRVKFCLKILSRFKKIIRKPQGGKIFWRTLYMRPGLYGQFCSVCKLCCCLWAGGAQ